MAPHVWSPPREGRSLVVMRSVFNVLVVWVFPLSAAVWIGYLARQRRRPEGDDG